MNFFNNKNSYQNGLTQNINPAIPSNNTGKVLRESNNLYRDYVPGNDSRPSSRVAP